ncbi:MAG TPA: hypothetical protein VHB02_02870 [Acidimicrobiales bacterium]|nr:hypothetical protein [Acidimicrobiales bacterium]
MAEGSRSDRPAYRGRPHWWAVLAVALGLMAVVATVSRAGGHTPRRGVAEGGQHRTAPSGPVPGGGPDDDGGTAGPAAGPGTGAATATGEPVETATTVPTSASVRSASTRSASSAGDPAGVDGAGSPGPAAAAVGTTASVGPPVPTTTTTGAAGATSTTTTVPGQTFSGYLASPDDISASYDTTGSGVVTATATWSGASTLTLSISCSDRTTNEMGPSGISISLPGGAGGDTACSVTLAEPPSAEGPVPYSLSITHSMD